MHWKREKRNGQSEESARTNDKSRLHAFGKLYFRITVQSDWPLRHCVVFCRRIPVASFNAFLLVLLLCESCLFRALIIHRLYRMGFSFVSLTTKNWLYVCSISIPDRFRASVNSFFVPISNIVNIFVFMYVVYCFKQIIIYSPKHINFDCSRSGCAVAATNTPRLLLLPCCV